jgi:hypothetical protein
MKKRITLLLFLMFTLSTILSPIAFAAGEIGNKVVSVGKSYLGVPYRYGGTTPSGFDCSGFTSYVFNNVGIQLPRTAAQQYNVGTPVNKSDLESGDLVFFAASSKSKISHVGIYIGNQEFISATSSRGIKIDSINDPYYWGSRYVGAKRVIQEVDQPIAASLNPGEYWDVPSSHWAYGPILNLTKSNVINGYGDSKFHPEDSITRAQVAKILSIVSTAEAVIPANEIAYYDVPENHWAHNYITTATASQLFNGYDGNVFKPDRPISRAEVAELITRAFNLELSGTETKFNDLTNDHWAYHSIQTLASHGMIQGYDDKTFKSENPTTRAEFTKILYNAMN